MTYNVFGGTLNLTQLQLLWCYALCLYVGNLNADETVQGYEVYSSTIADVLSEPSLHTPITVGLFARWGSGKSFLIGRLRSMLAVLTLVVTSLCNNNKTLAIETAGAWHETAIEVTQEIGRRITVVTEDTSETEFLFQRLSMALQRGNAVSFQNTMITEWNVVAAILHCLASIFPPAALW